MLPIVFFQFFRLDVELSLVVDPATPATTTTSLQHGFSLSVDGSA